MRKEKTETEYSGKDFIIRGVRYAAESGHSKATREIKEYISKPIFDEKAVLNKDPRWPKISIVTPSFNQAEFLERTILSVLNQNYPNLEYLIIDGDSTDGSAKIIKRYEKYLAYWVSEPDKGQGDAINKGLKMATGDIVAWQNSDDIYLNGVFSAVAGEFKRHPHHDVVFGNMYLIDADDVILKEMRFIPFNLEHLIYYDWNLSNQAVFWKRELFGRTGYLKNYEVSFDLDWFIRLGKTTKNFRFIKRSLGSYRIHPKSKLSLIEDDTRHALFIKVLRENGVDVVDSVDWKRQYRMKKLKAFLRRFFLYILQGDIGYILKGALKRIDRKQGART